jgi:hypothetical protein
MFRGMLPSGSSSCYCCSNFLVVMNDYNGKMRRTATGGENVDEEVLYIGVAWLTWG